MMSAAGKYMRRIDGGYLVWCPGCKEAHIVAVEKSLGNGARWSFNDDLRCPTFSPSLLVKTGRAVVPTYQPEPDDPPEICHSFIRDGEWQYLSDCTHPLAGKTVPVPEWPRSENQ